MAEEAIFTNVTLVTPKLAPKPTVASPKLTTIVVASPQFPRANQSLTVTGTGENE